MRYDELEKQYQVIKESMNRSDFSGISSLITEGIEEAKGKKKSLIEYIYEKDKDLYFQIFTTEEIIFDFPEEIFPHLEIKEVMNYCEEKVKQCSGQKREKFLGLFRIFYIFLLIINIKNRDEISIPKEENIVQALPESMETVDDKFFEDFKKSMFKVDIPNSVDFSKFKVGKNYIKNNRNFLKSDDVIPPYDLENMILGEPTLDKYELIKEKYEIDFNKIGDKKFEEDFIDNYFSKIDEAIKRVDFEVADHLMELLFKDFSNKEIVKEKYLKVKTRIGELNRVKNYIEKTYPRNRRENDPFLLHFLSEYEQTEGNIKNSIEYAKKAYEKSNNDFYYLVHYAKTTLLKDWKKARELVKEHIDKGYDKPDKKGLIFLTKRFLLKDEDFTKWLLDQYEKNFLNRGGEDNHVGYYSLLYRYHIKKDELDSAKKNLEQFIEKSPNAEFGYRKLSEFYSDKKHGEFFDLDKSLDYAKTCANIRGIHEGYYTGISYWNAEKWQKAIDEFEAFLREVGTVHPAYCRIYMHMFHAYMGLGNKKKACEVARKYLDLYEKHQNLELYKGEAFDTEGNLRDDLIFFAEIRENCRKHKNEVKRILKSRNLWENSLRKSIENQKLREEVEELSQKNKEIKEKYEDLDLDDEETYNKFISELENNEEKRAEVLKKLNKQNWIESKEKCGKRYKKFKDLPEEIQTFVKTAEFYMLSDNLELDYSGVILFYTKSLEKILDDKISQKFVEEIGQISNINDIEDEFIKPLFFHNQRSISLGKWGTLLKQIIEDETFGDDNISQQFYEHVENIFEENIGVIQKYASRFADIRNSKVHTDETAKNEIEEKIDTLREGMKEIFNIFY